MSVGAAGDDGNDSRDSDLSALFDRPFHTIEFEDGENESQVGSGFCIHVFPESKFNAVVGNGNDSSTPHRIAAGDIEFLPNLSAENAAKVRCMLAGQRGAISVDFIGDPATAGQKQFSVISCQSKTSCLRHLPAPERFY
jgi:hypothetical protein